MPPLTPNIKSPTSASTYSAFATLVRFRNAAASQFANCQQAVTLALSLQNLANQHWTLHVILNSIFSYFSRRDQAILPKTTHPHCPIFVFGTGRCGSTFVQSFLSSIGDIWIWGEHDGILADLVSWSARARGSEALQEFSFPYVGKNAYDIMSGKLGHPAWISGFSDQTVQNIERDAICELFGRNLPAGKQRWGFKEIRYGAPHNDVPRRLMRLFPHCTLLYVVRDPIKTISSMLSNFYPEIVKTAAASPSSSPELNATVASLATNWCGKTSYFLDLHRRYPQRVLVVKIEALDILAQISNFLRFDEPGPRSRSLNSFPNEGNYYPAWLVDYVHRAIADPGDNITRVAKSLNYAI